MSARLKLWLIRLIFWIDGHVLGYRNYHRIMMSGWWGHDETPRFYRWLHSDLVQGIADAIDHEILYGSDPHEYGDSDDDNG